MRSTTCLAIPICRRARGGARAAARRRLPGIFCSFFIGLLLVSGGLTLLPRPATALPGLAETGSAASALWQWRPLVQVQATDAPLHEAAASGDFELATYLLNEEAVDVDMRSGLDGSTALHVAAHTGRLDMARLLIDHGADVHARAAGGATPMHMAARAGHVPILDLLLASGADANAKLDMTTTPLNLAAREGHAAAVEFLLEHGAEIEVRSSHGRTPLMNGAERGQGAVVLLLLKHGANPKARDYGNRTALDIARATGHDRVAELLRDAAPDE